jgi:membrane fusion protein
VPGRVLNVSESAVSEAGPNGTTIPVYPASVALDRVSLKAYGADQPLLSGMTVSARIVAERQSLLQWLLDPLFAAGRL